MANLTPLLFLGAGALLVSSAMRKKKKRKPSGMIDDSIKSLPTPTPRPQVVSNWAQRQEALAFFGRQDICDCDPGGIDGKYGPSTKKAVKAFQYFAGITVDGKWGADTEKAMLLELRRLEQEGVPGPRPDLTPSDKDWTPDDIVVTDAECNMMLHISDELFEIQKRRAIEYALDGNTTGNDADAIHQEMVEEYAPLCASLGRDGVGPGVRKWWDQNVGHIFMILRGYEDLPDTLDEDAQSYGLS